MHLIMALALSFNNKMDILPVQFNMPLEHLRQLNVNIQLAKKKRLHVCGPAKNGTRICGVDGSH